MIPRGFYATDWLNHFHFSSVILIEGRLRLRPRKLHNINVARELRE